MSTLFGINNASYSAASQGMNSNAGLPKGDRLAIHRLDPRHFAGSAPAREAAEGTSSMAFENAMLKALDGVNAMQVDSSNATTLMMTDPDAIDVHDVTIAMAKANMSLNITRTVLDRVVRAWRDLINTR
jgi:flagellar hook-basal body complex protein FliE